MNCIVIIANGICYRDEEGPTLRVLACCWGPPNTGTTFVMLDVDGSILNVMRVGYLNIRALTPEQTQRKENDKARLLKVLTVYRPQIIVLGAAKVQCRYLNQDISEVSTIGCFRCVNLLAVVYIVNRVNYCTFRLLNRS